MFTIPTSLKQLSRFIAASFCALLLIAGCQQPEEKVQDAREKVADANQDLTEAKREARAEWQEAWLKVKRDNDEEIAENERRILDLRKDVNDIDTRYRAKYNTRIDELERRNIELRNRVNDYKDQGDERWEEFKKDLKREMDELRESLKNVNVKNN